MPTRVTPDNFNRAESDSYFSSIVHDGGFGAFHHNRALMPIDDQAVIRSNRDTLYSAAVFDLDAGPVTITLPDAGTRFISMQLIDEEQFAPVVVYEAGSYTIHRQQIGTRYVMAAIRILVDPGNPADLDQVHALQDAITVSQRRTGSFEVPTWDPVSHKKVHDTLLELGTTIGDSSRMFGPRRDVDPVRHLIGSAMAWGGNPEKDALYLNVTPDKNDGTTIYQMRIDDVPVEGFWSISVYNAEGYFEKNDQDAYTINNLTAKRAKDGSIHVQFGGTSDDDTMNVLPITPGWNYVVRLYRPRAKVLDGSWKFPAPKPL